MLLACQRDVLRMTGKETGTSKALEEMQKRHYKEKGYQRAHQVRILRPGTGHCRGDGRVELPRDVAAPPPRRCA
eukprot:6207942-Pleurochrysis_carterae.AAC.1